MSTSFERGVGGVKRGVKRGVERMVNRRRSVLSANIRVFNVDQT